MLREESAKYAMRRELMYLAVWLVVRIRRFQVENLVDWLWIIVWLSS